MPNTKLYLFPNAHCSVCLRGLGEGDEVLLIVETDVVKVMCDYHLSFEENWKSVTVKNTSPHFQLADNR